MLNRHHPVVDHLGAMRDVQKARHRGAIDIGIQKADREAERAQAKGKVRRRRGFADAALARGDSDDGAHAWDCCRMGAHIAARRFRRAIGAQLGRLGSGRLGLALCGHHDKDRLDFLEAPKLVFDDPPQNVEIARIAFGNIDRDDNLGPIDMDLVHLDHA